MKSVEITQNDDGTYSVSSEAEMPEAGNDPLGGGEAEDEDAEDAGQTFDSLDAALAAAAAMFDAPAEGGAPMIDGEEDFVSGFKNANGVNGGF